MSEETKIILERLDKLDQRFSDMDQRFSDMDQKFSDIDQRFSDMDQKFSDLSEKVADIDTRLVDLTGNVGKLADNVTDIQLTLENEVARKIMIIAEGHLDLNRKLDKALEIGNEKELMSLRITGLENDVKRLKAKANQIA